MTQQSGSRRWRGIIDAYRDRLPVTDRTPVVTLAEGNTPLVEAPRLSEQVGATVYLKVEGAKTARLIILGIKKKFRTQRKYAGLSLFLYAAINQGARRAGVNWGELGWTLEDNGPVNTGIKMMGAKKYKTYRVFEKSLS